MGRLLLFLSCACTIGADAVSIPGTRSFESPGTEGVAPLGLRCAAGSAARLIRCKSELHLVFGRTIAGQVVLRRADGGYVATAEVEGAFGNEARIRFEDEVLEACPLGPCTMTYTFEFPEESRPISVYAELSDTVVKFLCDEDVDFGVCASNIDFMLFDPRDEP